MSEVIQIAPNYDGDVRDGYFYEIEIPFDEFDVELEVEDIANLRSPTADELELRGGDTYLWIQTLFKGSITAKFLGVPVH